MELAVADDGRVFYVERITGEINVYNPVNGQVTTALTLPVSSRAGERRAWASRSPRTSTPPTTSTSPTRRSTPNNQTRVSRFTVGANNTIAPASEQIIFQWTAQRDQCCHSGGSLAFGADGDLYISTGDNTNPFASDGFAPIDERPGREFWDAQRTSANSNNHNGKILRIHPLPSATGVPGIGTTYTIPSGNMFAPGTRRRRCPRSTRWASATRSGSPSIRTRAGCWSATTGLTPARRSPTAARRAASSSRSSSSRASTAGPTACATTCRTTTTTSPTARPVRSSTART